MTNDQYPYNAEDATAELTESFAESIHALFSAGTIAGTLQAVVDLSVVTIEGCDFAGIFLLDKGGVRTPVQTDPIVSKVDEAQRRCGEGPCLDAISQGGTVYADELSDDTRWPRFGPEASAIGIRSALALHLSANSALGALNLYATFPQAFGVIDRAKALLLAATANLALTSAEALENEERRSDDLQRALASREVIGQAEGILMERERITAEQAFIVLRRASQHLNVKLRDVAQDLVDTGETPATGPNRLAL